ncbi:uncharacterized protein LOC125225164 [Leguminivora glycinivorella]|uniref:uncharacterized protein LOC125225164 n=1 Tax=Leguminivora glycinivorella TaxID=1035111 RepID=UPI0020106896|nr:uncharacterized protein LOC125225164 [Leguminivora glycinivorella]
MAKAGRIVVTFNVTKTLTLTKGKIVMFAVDKEIRLQIGNPCKHIFVKPIFETLFNVTKKCQIEKGLYQRDVDLEDYITSYFGGSFFYGNVTFKSTFYSDECNFTCSNVGVELTPKK